MTTYEIIQNLCRENKIAVTALERELGFGRGSIGKMKTGGTSAKRLQMIADYFGVSIEYLITNKESAERDIAKQIENTLSDLASQEALMFSGEPMDDNTRELLKISLENSIKVAKINAKQLSEENK